MGTANSDSSPLLFISHKHVDSDIANVLASFIKTWSGGRVRVFQSSSPWEDAPKSGRHLNKQLRERLWEASVVVLIYTSPDQDWSYCMWECGVASHPQSPDTRIIVFQCARTPPAQFADQAHVNVRSLASLQQFVDDFLTSPDFFPSFPGKITAFKTRSGDVEKAAAELFEKLKPVLPLEKEDTIEWSAQPFLQLELGFDVIDQIPKPGSRDRSRIGSGLILKQARISAADDYCKQMFGAPGFLAGTTLEQLVAIWKARRSGADAKWVRSLCAQILAGVTWQLPPVTWELMQGLNDDAWRAPILNRVRRNSIHRCMQFDLYFYRFEPKGRARSVQIAIPKPVSRRKKKAAPARPQSRQNRPRRVTSA